MCQHNLKSYYYWDHLVISFALIINCVIRVRVHHHMRVQILSPSTGIHFVFMFVFVFHRRSFTRLQCMPAVGLFKYTASISSSQHGTYSNICVWKCRLNADNNHNGSYFICRINGHRKCASSTDANFTRDERTVLPLQNGIQFIKRK